MGFFFFFNTTFRHKQLHRCLVGLLSLTLTHCGVSQSSGQLLEEQSRLLDQFPKLNLQTLHSHLNQSVLAFLASSLRGFLSPLDSAQSSLCLCALARRLFLLAASSPTALSLRRWREESPPPRPNNVSLVNGYPIQVSKK